VTDLLVGTNRGLFLVRDGDAREVNAGPGYGVTWDHSHLYRVRGGWVQRHGSLEGGGKPVGRCVHDLHQILWWDGSLYVTETSRDRVQRWTYGAEECVYDASGTGEDRNHVNSVWCDGASFYVVEHRRGNEPMRIVRLDRAFRRLDAFEFRDLTSMHHCGLHNVYVEDGVLYTLSVDEFLGVDVKSRARETVWKGGDYLRGLARTEGRWWVGRSNLAVRGDRAKGDGSVVVLDDGFGKVDEIVIKDCGQVHEVRALKGDRAHNGLDCPEGVLT
jgi:hypothetical protein